MTGRYETMVARAGARTCSVAIPNWVGMRAVKACMPAGGGNSVTVMPGFASAIVAGLALTPAWLWLEAYHSLVVVL
jgi:hypothetical protein